MTDVVERESGHPALRFANDWVVAGLCFLVSATLYWGVAVWSGRTTTPEMAYFDHLANAFLHGRSYLANPPATHDLTLHQGRWYVSFPPLPALLLLPWVAWRGLAHTNTVLFSVLMAGLNVALVYLILQSLRKRGWTRLRRSDHLWLTGLFAFGTVHWYMAAVGSVWFVSQICTVTFVALAVWLALETESPWLAGMGLALAVLARPHVVLLWPMLLGIVLQQWACPPQNLPWRRLIGWSIRSAIPVGGAVLGLLAYNQARFGNPFDFGYLSANVARKLIADLRTYGQFHPHYLGRNLRAMLFQLPRWDERVGLWVPDPEGLSLFITTPALVYLVRAIRWSYLVVGTWTAVGLVLVPLLTYYNTGWWQFGYRFSLDFLVPLMVLLAIATRDGLSWKFRVLVVAGMLVNAWGVVWWYS